NHSWHATFYVTPSGLASSPIPDGPGIEIFFDFREHMVVGACGDGRKSSFMLEPMTVATFHARFIKLISELGGTPTFNGQPNEVPDLVPFKDDQRDRPYDRDAVQRFHQALVSVDGVFNLFRTSFLGKSSPVHLFWGSFDLAVTRFSGRRAPLHPGGIPALPDNVAQEAYDREVSSAGFWPGGGGIDYPAFYAYAYPSPNGYRAAPVQPDAAFWHEQLSEFMLPYDAVQTAQDGDAALLAFLRSTYEAAADLGRWDRDVLECGIGRPATVRPSDPVSEQHRKAPLPDEPVLREDGVSKGRYHMLVDRADAEMTYSRASETLVIIDHTAVPDALRGRRVGEKMVRQAVDDARSEGFTIIPLCPFAKAQIDRNPELQDVLHQPKAIGKAASAP
ncbi:MAG: DUF5996 family protein, partial [Thermomicrobiales bacterium]